MADTQAPPKTQDAPVKPPPAPPKVTTKARASFNLSASADAERVGGIKVVHPSGGRDNMVYATSMPAVVTTDTPLKSLAIVGVTLGGRRPVDLLKGLTGNSGGLPSFDATQALVDLMTGASPADWTALPAEGTVSLEGETTGGAIASVNFDVKVWARGSLDIGISVAPSK